MSSARDVVRVAGPDALSFLQGQLSQDLHPLAVGSSAWSWVLQPQGKVDALVEVTRTADDAFELAVDGGHGHALHARISRFKLRTKVDITLEEAGAPPLAATEADRIERGWPAMGKELDERTIPAETGLVGLTVSFTKGCYTGQELVARIDSRGGNVPRHLRRLRASEGEIAAGSAIVVDGREVGTVTSSAGPVALGYVARAVEGAATGRVGSTPVAIEVIDR